MFYGESRVTLRRHADTHGDAKVRFACAACGSRHDVAAEQIIWLLEALQLGDAQTTLADSARLDDHACVRCGGTCWEAWPCP